MGMRRDSRETMNNECQFSHCEISQLGKFQAKFGFPPLEHLQQHKTKNYEKISLKMRKFTKFEN